MPAHKYLARHAEPEAIALALDDEFDFVLVLPCYDEDTRDIERFATLCARHNALLIVVVNQPDTVATCARNNAALDWLRRGAVTSLADHVSLCRVDTARVLLIDRTLQRIPVAQGVGLARKIGADCALALIAQGRIRTPWIFCTDADATLPENYFAATRGRRGSALVLAFEHVPCGDAGVDLATALYELRLHDYVAGLRRAGSPYAFHSLGSTLVVDAAHYAAAHGFPKRAGGEDFYLLNKLVKLAPVTTLAAPRLQLQSRASHRVPFGTGPATQKLLTTDDMLVAPLFYDLRGFDLLALWLRFLDHCAQQYAGTTTDSGQWPAQLERFCGRDSSDTLEAAIDASAFSHTLRQAQRHNRTPAACARYLHAWFDGFRTLKLLHALRDRFYPLQDFTQRFGALAPHADVLQQVSVLNRRLRDTQDHVNTIVVRGAEPFRT